MVGSSKPFPQRLYGLDLGIPSLEWPRKPSFFLFLNIKPDNKTDRDKTNPSRKGDFDLGGVIPTHSQPTPDIAGLHAKLRPGRRAEKRDLPSA